MRVLRRGWAGIDDAVNKLSRLPAGHPEGFIEAFANIYNEFAEALYARMEGRDYKGLFPSVDSGVRGMNFIENAVRSSENHGQWRKLNLI